MEKLGQSQYLDVLKKETKHQLHPSQSLKRLSGFQRGIVQKLNMRISLIYLFLVLLSSTCSSQIDSLLMQIAAENEVHHHSVGFSGSTSDQYRRYLKLVQSSAMALQLAVLIKSDIFENREWKPQKLTY